MLRIIKQIVLKFRESKRINAKTHPIGYQLAQAIMKDDEIMKNNNRQGV